MQITEHAYFVKHTWAVQDKAPLADLALQVGDLLSLVLHELDQLNVSLLEGLKSGAMKKLEINRTNT